MVSCCERCRASYSSSDAACYFCGLENHEQTVTATKLRPDPLPPLADTFEDYARIAQDSGKWGEADIWQRAADIARGFVPRT